MFASHILTAQDKVEEILDDRIMNRMQTLANREAEPGDRSKTIAQLLLGLMRRSVMCPAPPPVRDESECQRPRPMEDKSLIEQLTAHVGVLEERKLWTERLEHFNCAHCSCVPQESFITSCLHRYCEECFEILPDKNGKTDTAERKCCSCGLNIRSIVFCINVPASEISSGQLSSGEKRKNMGKEQSGSRRKTKTRSRQERQAQDSFSKWARSQESSFQSEERPDIPFDIDAEPESVSKNEFEPDWISLIGNSMPGAKITAAQDQIRKWLAEDEEAKIVVFTEFLDSSRLLRYMCKANEWGYAVVCCAAE
jgi:hypothetical protein